MNRKRVTLAASAALLGSLALVGCSKGMGDSPVANGGKGDDSPAAVTNFPDHFANIATKCLAGAPGYRAFVTTRNAPPVVLPDPACK